MKTTTLFGTLILIGALLLAPASAAPLTLSRLPIELDQGLLPDRPTGNNEDGTTVSGDHLSADPVGVVNAPAPNRLNPAIDGGVAGAAGADDIAQLIGARSGKPPSKPLSGITGAADNLGAGIANFGNGQGSAFDALLSGASNGIGTLLSGTFGSGAVSTAFQNFNNKPKA